jgi:hypothetical protein
VDINILLTRQALPFSIYTLMKHYKNNHIDQLITIMHLACYAIRAVKDLTSQETLMMIYFSYVHSGMTYGIIFWGNSPYGINIFRIQKCIIRIIMNPKARHSCWELFKNLKILPLYSQYIYIYSSSLFVTNNKDQYISNHEIHVFNARHNMNLHPPTLHLAVFQRGPYYLELEFLIISNLI